ncbi:hypothetical protein LDENG_00290250 [Lucifuga dentata]|nr:hypothetical protein LDENG_00290250 [Lucifuga dentata]
MKTYLGCIFASKQFVPLIFIGVTAHSNQPYVPFNQNSLLLLLFRHVFWHSTTSTNFNLKTSNQFHPVQPIFDFIGCQQNFHIFHTFRNIPHFFPKFSH